MFDLELYIESTLYDVKEFREYLEGLQDFDNKNVFLFLNGIEDRFLEMKDEFIKVSIWERGV